MGVQAGEKRALAQPLPAGVRGAVLGPALVGARTHHRSALLGEHSGLSKRVPCRGLVI